jgi:hypothetical protein
MGSSRQRADRQGGDGGDWGRAGAAGTGSSRDRGPPLTAAAAGFDRGYGVGQALPRGAFAAEEAGRPTARQQVSAREIVSALKALMAATTQQAGSTAQNDSPQPPGPGVGLPPATGPDDDQQQQGAVVAVQRVSARRSQPLPVQHPPRAVQAHSAGAQPDQHSSQA